MHTAWVPKLMSSYNVAWWTGLTVGTGVWEWDWTSSRDCMECGNGTGLRKLSRNFFLHLYASYNAS